MAEEKNILTTIEQSAQPDSVEKTGLPHIIIPAHSNKMAMSIICTLFCCLIGGIIAIVNSSKSNSLYNQAMFSTDDAAKAFLYQQSEEKNKSAQTWITVSIITGLIAYLAYIILVLVPILNEEGIL